MSQPVSQKFINASKSDANKPVSKIQMVLGNYASSSAYGSTASATSQLTNYPASGSIDGDRTEINIGPASGADNNIGQSSWQSSVAPDTTPQVLTITFSTTRTINRVKLYHLSGHGLRTYKLEYWDGAVWQIFAQTTDLGGTVATTGTLDTIDFSDVSTTQIRLTVSHTAIAADMANVVELEVYRLIDVTDRVKSVKPSRQRDYKLANPMAAQVDIDLLNDDRYFSISHTPTSDEVAQGFVNQELRPDMGIIVQQGFDVLTASPEMVTVFIGNVDSITINPSMREATISARDGMKTLINSIDSCKLKADISTDSAIRYVLNRQNVSNYEMSLDVSPINIDYFFTEQQAPLDTIRDLTQASGDCLFYYDELGIATFRDYSGNLPIAHLWTSDIDWDSGNNANLARLGSFSGELAAVAGFAPALASGSLSGDLQIDGANLDFVSSAAFNGDSFSLGSGTIQDYQILGVGHGKWIGEKFVIPRDGTINTLTIGGWSTQLSVNASVSIVSGSSAAPDFGTIYWSSSPISSPQSSPVTLSPGVHISGGTTIWIVAVASSNPFTTFNFAQTSNPDREAMGSNVAQGGPYFNIADITVGNRLGMVSGFTFTYDTISKSGGWTSSTYDSLSSTVSTAQALVVSGSYPGAATATIFIDGGPDGSSWPDTYTFVNPSGTNSYTGANHEFWRIRVSASTSDNVFVPVISPPMVAFNGNSGTWTSPVLDTGSNTIAFGAITDTRVLNSGSIAYSTRSSPDGITWSPYVALSGAGVIQSPLNRYIQVQVVITCGIFNLSPLILDITVNWTGGAGHPKYPSAPASFTFSFDSMLLDVQQSLADNVGGDTSILNDISVQAQPLVLTGSDSDTVWQGTIGTPPSNISGSTPLTVTPGEVLVISPIISGGIDISRMSGANPAAAVVVFGGGASGSWVFSSIHPTTPALTITIGAGGTITDLRIIGKTFSNASYIQASESSDTTSIALYGDRQLSISNQWIVSSSVAQSIGDSLLSNFKDPVSYIPSAQVRFSPSAQLGDRVTISDENLDMTADYIIVGIDNPFSVQEKKADVSTNMVLLKVPAGL